MSLLRRYDLLHREDVPVRTLVRTHHLAKSSSAAGWAAFRTLLASTAASAGQWVGAVPAVPPAYTSLDGSGGGARVPTSLSSRTHTGPSGGLVLDRAEHTALTSEGTG